MDTNKESINLVRAHSRCFKMTPQCTTPTTTLAARPLIRLVFVALLITYIVSLEANCDDALEEQKEPVTLWLTGGAKTKVEDAKLAAVLGRVGPNMRASMDYHDHTDIKLAESVLAWKLMRHQAKTFARQQVDRYGTSLDRLLSDAKVSKSCRESVQILLSSARNLDFWSIQMWNSGGNFPPVGWMDGQFTDLGSYRGCVDLTIDPDLDRPKINGTNYCLFAFRPVVPSRKQFHRIIEREPEQLWEQFSERDYFRRLAKEAQLFHYVYVKTGVCVPNACIAQDMQLVANLIAHKLVVQSGPVKCFTRGAMPGDNNDTTNFQKIENEPVQVYIDRSLNRKQWISSIVVGAFFTLVALATILQLLDSSLPWLVPTCFWGKTFLVHYFSAVTNAKVFLNTSQRPNEIKCLHIMRTVIMIWIMILHTMQYNDWSQFTRVFETAKIIRLPFWHALFNGAPLVDFFFLMSGLLASYTAVVSSRSFSMSTSLINRYLRLSPQALLVSLLYIILPLIGDSPFWYDVTHQYGKYCERNWWVNILHLQAFYKKGEICNLVGWWISVDMFLYVLALCVLKLIFDRKRKQANFFCFIIVLISVGHSAIWHYNDGLLPQNHSLAPQINEVWTRYVNSYFWSPYPHAFAFFLGFWLGTVIAFNKYKKLIIDWFPVCKALCLATFVVINAVFYAWSYESVTFENQLLSTGYQISTMIVWSIWFGWIIVACHYGCMPTIDNISNSTIVILLSKASFIIYLSHMLVFRYFYGTRNVLFEVSTMTVLHVIVGNIFISILFGTILSITSEVTFMKFQKVIVEWITPSDITKKTISNKSSNSDKHHAGDEYLEEFSTNKIIENK